jgi:myo-inositol 2-dehydrogenase/D-chiro-inositol 1-dehydrogenase
MKRQTRRHFLQSIVRSGAGLAVLPGLLPARVSVAGTANRKIQVAQIGCGRMGRSDMGNILTQPIARVVAVCDVDRNRLSAGKAMAEDYYRQRDESSVSIKCFHDYREILASPEIDAVVISVPDHAHALTAISAAIAGKAVYVQKPVTYSIAEAIGLRRAVEAKKIILQTGSQQRSERPWGSFRAASEAVRNGRIGRLHTIKIGLGLDQPSGHPPAPMPVPPNLDYEHWLGSAPEQPYMELHVHPQATLDGRPGWMTTEDFGLGMITNWGAHHLDIAQWAMGQELGGPLGVEAQAQFMSHDAWNVHTTYHVEMQYPGKVRLILDNQFRNGLRFEGDEGWVFCCRGEEEAPANAIDPNMFRPLLASDPKILAPLPDDAICWAPSKNHYLNWLESIISHREPIAPIQQSARSLEACVVAWISMKLGRKVVWNAGRENFEDDAAANALCSRPSRTAEFDFERVLKQAGIA